MKYIIVQNSYVNASTPGRPRRFSYDNLAAASKVLVSKCNSLFTSASLPASCAELSTADPGVQPHFFCRAIERVHGEAGAQAVPPPPMQGILDHALQCQAAGGFWYWHAAVH
jgi:hypothetical protein